MITFRNGILVGAIMAACVTPVLASDDGVLRARIGVSTNDFTTIWSGGDLETDYTSLNFGTTYITPNAFYLDLGVKKDTSASWNTMELNPNLNDGKDEDYSRTDVTLTIGKALDNGIQLFAGYQDSSATIALPAISWVQGTGSVEEEEVDVDGFFFGVGKSFKIGEGSVNLNAAYAFMDATLIDADGGSHDSTDGDGYSVGASYTRYLSEAVAVNFELKQQKYSYEFNADSPNTGGDDKMTMMGVNLVYQF